jgi:hypothetical protein
MRTSAVFSNIDSLDSSYLHDSYLNNAIVLIWCDIIVSIRIINSLVIQSR